jgi:hypothetical protein
MFAFAELLAPFGHARIWGFHERGAGALRACFFSWPWGDKLPSFLTLLGLRRSAGTMLPNHHAERDEYVLITLRVMIGFYLPLA